jgi:hypothetical protein
MKTYLKKFMRPILGWWLIAPAWLAATELNPVIERVPGRGGYIETAHVRAGAEQTEVSGYVRRSTIGEPPAGSHVDVVVYGPDARVIGAASARYSPAKIPGAGRLGLPHARFRVRLEQRVPSDATIRVVFHGGPAGASGCVAAAAAKTDRTHPEGQ